MLFLIPLLPLIGFLVNGIWYAFFQTGEGKHRADSTVTGLIGTFAIFGAFVVSVLHFLQLHGMPEEERVIIQNLYNWIHVTGFKLDVGFRFDALSSLFCLVITGVGTLIHVYSIGYMSHD